MASTNISASAASRPAVSSTQRDGFSAYALIAPSMDEIGLLFFVAILGGISLMLQGIWVTAMNLVIPGVLMVTMARATVVSLTRSVATVWSPLVWMRAAIFFYGGFGTITVIIGSDAMRDYAETFFVFYAEDILRYNLVVLVFTTMLLLSCKGFLLIFGGRRSVTEIFNPQVSSIGLSMIGTLFVAVGLAANLVFIIPYQFGFINTTFPAVISEVAQAANIGLFLSLVAMARSRSPLIWIILFIGLSLSLVGLLAFSKAAVTLPMVMLLLAYFYLRPSLARLAVMVGVTLATFFLSAPLVDHGRNIMSQRYGGIDAPALPGERMEILQSYFDPRTVQAGDAEVDYASLRFSYVNVGSFVVNLRDSGQTGGTYDNALAIFVPRIIWKDKPVITEMARRLSYEATGNWNNSVAPGLAPEAYWNGGYVGVIFMGALTGLIVSLWSIYNLATQVAGAWHLFPVVLLGVRMGSRFDGFFVPDVMGPIAFALMGHFLLSFLNAAIARRGLARNPVTG